MGHLGSWSVEFLGERWPRVYREFLRGGVYHDGFDKESDRRKAEELVRLLRERENNPLGAAILAKQDTGEYLCILFVTELQFDGRDLRFRVVNSKPLASYR